MDEVTGWATTSRPSCKTPGASCSICDGAARPVRCRLSSSISRCTCIARNGAAHGWTLAPDGRHSLHPCIKKVDICRCPIAAPLSSPPNLFLAPQRLPGTEFLRLTHLQRTSLSDPPHSSRLAQNLVVQWWHSSSRLHAVEAC